jgi:hypothetical protein
LNKSIERERIKLAPTFERDLIQIIFVGLAALTVPHAWVLNKSKFSEWATSYYKQGI